MQAVSLSEQQKAQWLALLMSENVGPVTFFRLIRKFGDAETALKALPSLSARGGMKRALRMGDLHQAERRLEKFTAQGGKVIAHCEADYPKLLRQTEGAPPLLWIKGRSELLRQTGLAIVGSRNASASGLAFARSLAAEIGAAGYVTISGLARGIDTAVHQASLETGTIAVVAGGVDIIYPPENKALHHALFEMGLVVSEMLPGMRPQGRHFPRRNRIISGLAAGAAVIEAGLRSGSLITARLANEQNRDVFAVPGSPLDPRAAGTNKLIKDGATLITDSQDITAILSDIEQRQLRQGDFFAEMADETVHDLSEENIFADHEEDLADAGGDFGDPSSDAGGNVEMPHEDLTARVIALLGTTPTSADQLARESGADVAQIQAILLELELAGRLERHTGQRVSLLGGGSGG